MPVAKLEKLGKLATILSVPLWRHALLRYGVAAAVEHAPVLRRLAELRTVVDIGANRGQFALAVRHYFPDARIFSFEPLPAPARVYRAVFEGDERSWLVPYALGSAAGDAVIHVSSRDDSSSLLPITNVQNEIFPGTCEAGITTVKVARLTEQVGPESIEMPALLKLDVQGFELQALKGCEDVIERFRWVYAECSFIELYSGQALAHEVIAWLRERGFVFIGSCNVVYGRDGFVVQTDCLFERRRGPARS